jgi:hypothetical protein
LQGWDKTYCLRFVEADGFKEIHFFGDKTYKVRPPDGAWARLRPHPPPQPPSAPSPHPEGGLRMHALPFPPCWLRRGAS